MFIQRARESVVHLSDPPLPLASEHGFVQFHTHLPSTVYAEVHKSHTIQVEVEAYPQPNIVWLKNNEILTMESSSKFTITSRNLSETRYGPIIPHQGAERGNSQRNLQIAGWTQLVD